MPGGYTQRTNQWSTGGFDLFAPEPSPEPTVTASTVATVTRPRAEQVRRAEARRDAALARVEGTESDAWRTEARAFLHRFLEEHAEMHPDDLWDAGFPEPPGSRRMVGAVIKAAIAKGWMQASGQYRPSVSSNMTPKPVYRSLVYRDPWA